MRGYNPKQFRDLITRILEAQNLYSEVAVNLLLGTAAQESHFGYYLRQVSGPALGAFQMEPDTEKDIWKNYLKYRPEKQLAIAHISGVFSARPASLETNLAYSICMARIHYRRVKEPFPTADNIYGLGCYWDRFYNCNPHKGTVTQFVENYQRYVK